jgi:anti-sigma regulatory factor (Ser/Thr protein kinase)
MRPSALPVRPIMPREARLVYRIDWLFQMRISEQAVFPARFAALPDTAALAHAFCDRCGIDRDDALRLTLIIEELFTNTIEHGHGGECDAAIRIALSFHEGAVTLLYEDSAPRYDPLSQDSVAASTLEEDIDARSIGGLGVRLVRELASEARYAYEEGNNRLWLTLKSERR